MNRGEPPEMGGLAERYHTKTFTWHNSPTRVAIMVTKFDAEGHRPLEKEGYGGGCMLYHVFAGGTVRCHYDAYRITWPGEVCAGMMKSLHTGGIDWESFEDGETYGPKEGMPEDVEK